MRARQAVLTGPGRLEMRETDLSLPADHLMVRMEGCGLCTSEIPLWTGQTDKYPTVMGHEAWGVVVEKGPDVSDRIPIGAKVTGLPLHCFADYYTQPEWATMLVGPEVTEKAILGEPYYCVGNVVRAARPEMGDHVAVVGLGPMGQWALQALAWKSLGSLVAIDVDDEKLRFATESGATHAVNPTRDDAVELMKDITGGRLADVVIEGTGAKAGMDLAVNLLRRGPRPRLVVMSFFKKPIEIDITRLCGVSAEIICAHPGITADRPDHCRRTETLINTGVFRSDHLITHRYRLDELGGAFDELVNRPAGYVKGVVTP